MLTIFSFPKPFEKKIGIIQRNAVKSWSSLTPRPEIILLGNEKGVKDICRELNLIHFPHKGRRDILLVNEIFNEGQEKASNHLVCYINSDIILLNDFIKTVDSVQKKMNKASFLLAGKRWNIELQRPLTFTDPYWEEKLKAYTLKHGKGGGFGTIDYFVFTKGLIKDMPPFEIGVTSYDSWILYKARRDGSALVDASMEIMAIHQNHLKKHHTNRKTTACWETAVLKDKKLCIFRSRFYSLLDATHLVIKSELIEIYSKRRLRRILSKLSHWIIYLLKDTCYPYSSPFVKTVRKIKSVFR